MADSATTRNRFRKQEVGAKTNAWGLDWNEDGGSDRLDEALDGVSAFTLSGTKTLSSTNYETDESRMRILNITSGTGGTVTLPAVEKWYLIRNNTSGSVIFTAGGTTATVPTGAVVPIFCDGSAVYASNLSAYVNACEAAQTAAELAETHAETAETNAETAETNAGVQAAAAAASAASAAASAATAASVIGTSTTSLAIAVASKTFTTQAGKNWTVGSYVIAASAADPANYMFGQVTSYSSTTLIVNVEAVGGSGTFADWNISLTGPRGATGATGATGAAGSAPDWTQLATGSATGTAVAFTGIATSGYTDLMVEFVGFDTSSDGTVTIEISTNNGSSYSTGYALGSIFGSGAAFSTQYQFLSYRRDFGLVLFGQNSSNASGVARWALTGGINAVRISTGGTMSGGTFNIKAK